MLGESPILTFHSYISIHYGRFFMASMKLGISHVNSGTVVYNTFKSGVYFLIGRLLILMSD